MKKGLNEHVQCSGSLEAPPVVWARQVLAVRPPKTPTRTLAAAKTLPVSAASCPSEASPAKSFKSLEHLSLSVCPQSLGFFPPTVGMLLLLIHKEFRPNPKHLFSDFKLHLFCIHTVGDQLSSTVLLLPPPPHSLPKHRAESRPQAYQFLRQPSHNSSRATEQERLKKEGAKGKESLGRL